MFLAIASTTKHVLLLALVNAFSPRRSSLTFSLLGSMAAGGTTVSAAVDIPEDKCGATGSSGESEDDVVIPDSSSKHSLLLHEGRTPTCTTTSNSVLLQCDICDESWRQHEVTNWGNKDYPKYRDKNCHAASRFYDAAVKSQGQVPGTMKTRNPLRHKKNVLRMRLKGKDDPPELAAKMCCITKTDRRA